MSMHRLTAWLYRLALKVFRGTGIAGVFPFSRLKPLIVRYLRSAPYVRVHGKKMYLDPKDSVSLAIYGVCEPQETELIRRSVKKGDVVVDLGANVGYFTLILAELVGNTGKVFAFEPDFDNFALVKKNVQINGYENVVIEQKAASSTTGRTRLYLSEICVDHRIYPPGGDEEHRESLEVQTIHLDGYAPLGGVSVDFIKMDIQGAEGLVLKGMKETASRSGSLKILMEFWPYGLQKAGTDPQELLRELGEMDFQILELGQDGKPCPADMATLVERCGTGDHDYVNLYCIKGGN